MKTMLMPDGRVLEGTPLEIVQCMHATAIFQQDLSLTEYMDWLVVQMKSVTGREVLLAGKGDEQRAESLVKAMIEEGLAVG